MFIITHPDGEHIELEFSSIDILDYMGRTLLIDDEPELAEGFHTVDDAFILAYGWFEDHDDWDKVNAYRKGMNCSVQEAFEQCEEAYMGEYRSEAAFSESLHRESIAGLPAFIQSNIDWQAVWDSTDRHDYFEQDGFFFQNL